MSVRRKKQAMSAEELEKLMAELPPQTWDEIQKLRKVLRTETKKVAIDQIARAMPDGSGSSDSHPSFQDGALFATFLPLPDGSMTITSARFFADELASNKMTLPFGANHARGYCQSVAIASL